MEIFSYKKKKTKLGIELNFKVMSQKQNIFIVLLFCVSFKTTLPKLPFLSASSIVLEQKKEHKTKELRIQLVSKAFCCLLILKIDLLPSFRQHMDVEPKKLLIF